LLPLVARRRRIPQHLAHHVSRDPELPCYRPLTSPLNQYRTSHTSIEFHPVHPSGVP
jgi:hypothetical protein